MITAAPANIVYLVKAVVRQKGRESEPQLVSNPDWPRQEVAATRSNKSVGPVWSEDQRFRTEPTNET